MPYHDDYANGYQLRDEHRRTPYIPKETPFPAPTKDSIARANRDGAMDDLHAAENRNAPPDQIAQLLLRAQETHRIYQAL